MKKKKKMADQFESQLNRQITQDRINLQMINLIEMLQKRLKKLENEFIKHR